MNVFYFDDEREQLDSFGAAFSDIFAGDKLELISDSDKLRSFLATTGGIDIAFLDMEYNKERNGLDLARYLRTLFPRVVIIYITAYTEKFVQEAFYENQNVAGFLVKPVDRNSLEKVLEKARKMAYDSNRTIAIKPIDSRITILYEKDIRYIESKGHRLHYMTVNGEYVTYEKISDAMRELSAHFVQCHKSFLLNMDMIQSVTNDKVVMSDGTEITISASRRKEFINAFTDYALGKRCGI